MLEYIYICRHGFRSNWVDPTIKTGPTGMNRDPPLAAYGQKQASRLAAFLSDSKYPVAVEAGADPRPVPELVFSSPFYRCIETSLPTYQALKELPGGCGQGILLEHGVQEWYSTVVPDTGLHPRPASPSSLSPLFPPNSIDESYASTYLPSRRGETLRELHDRADCFIEAWTARVEEMGVRCVVVFAHAASVIALGRALTGDKNIEVPAGCASTSLYKRKAPGSTDSMSSQWTAAKSTVDTILDKTGLSSFLKSDTESAPQLDEKSSPLPCGVGEWEPVFLGKADYLENGLERNWSFKDVVVVNGEVIEDNGDRVPHQPEDSIPTGFNDGMEKYLRRGLPKKNDQIKEIVENTVRKAELSRI